MDDIRVMLGAPALLLVHPTIFYNSVNAPTPPSSFLRLCLSLFSFMVRLVLSSLLSPFGVGFSLLREVPLWWR